MRSEDLLVQDILHILNEEKLVISGSVVGSVEEKSFNEISDIDIVVIVDEISFKIINKIKNLLLDLEPKDYGIDLEFKINDTFGPLKFDNPNELYFHLMIYDIDGHIEHVTQSPFTCFDWERTNLASKSQLNKIFSVRRLMLHDFLNSRRGIYDYISDLNKNQISYRCYEKNSEGNIVQIKKYLDIDSKHLIEYCYHIIRNSISNILKFLNNNNTKFQEDVFLENWQNQLPELYFKYYEFYKYVQNKKISKSFDESFSVNNIISFLDDFYNTISNTYEDSKKIVLIRHFETQLNDGRLFGQNDDVSIIKQRNNINLFDKYDINEFSALLSPSKRAIETFESFDLSIDFEVDKRLQEINYGDAEGLFFEEFIKNFSSFKSKINKNVDFTYPNGESYGDLFRRVNESILSVDQNSLIFTHQGPIRVLLGNLFNIKYGEMYKLKIPHGVPIEILKIRNKLYPNISREVYYEIFKELINKK